MKKLFILLSIFIFFVSALSMAQVQRKSETKKEKQVEKVKQTEQKLVRNDGIKSFVKFPEIPGIPMNTNNTHPLFNNNMSQDAVNGYTFTSSSGTYTALSTETILWLGNLNDEISDPITIPSFSMDGTAFTTMYVSVNGWITLGAIAPSGIYPISGDGTYSRAISAFGWKLNQADAGTPKISYNTNDGGEIVIQYQDVRRYSFYDERLSFQIRLNPSTGNIKFVYGGTITGFVEMSNLQVGLRGSTNTDYNNRTTDTDWSNTTAGGSNSATCTFSSTVLPAVGQTFTWAPPIPPTLVVSPSTLAFGYVASNGTSSTMTYSLSGTNLTADPIVLTPPPNFEISTNGGTTWVANPNTISIAYTPPTLGSTTISVRFKPTSLNTEYSGNITNVGGGASTNVGVTGSTYLYSRYCTSNAGYTEDEEITNVTLGTINNTSTCSTTGGIGSILNRYSNYTTTVSPTDLQQGSSNAFSVTQTSCGGTNYNAFKIFIDFNQDGDFADTGEEVYVSTTYYYGDHTETGNISVPGGATLGNTMMRVINVETTVPSGIVACGSYDRGETEDYFVNIIEASSLSATTLTGFDSVCINTTAGPNSFTINGLFSTTANVTVGALTGFSYSTTEGGTYTNSLSLTQPGGSYSQEIFVKFAPTLVQSYNGNIPIGGGGATSINVAVTGRGVNSAPTVTYPYSKSITGTSATLCGNMTSKGCSNVTERGIYWSTTNGFPNGTGTKVSEIPGPNPNGHFEFPVSGLSGSTTYYFKAFATNGVGTSYSVQSSFTTLCVAIQAPFTQNFEIATFPPTCWSLVATDYYKWARSTTVSGYGTGTACSYIDFFNMYSNYSDLITSEFSTSSLTNPQLNFDHAYATRYIEVDNLHIEYSTDNGSSFTFLISYSGGVSGPLNTGGASLVPFVPTPEQWATKSINLPAGTNKLKFHGSCHHGNNLYIDNIKVIEAPTNPIFRITPITKDFGNSTIGGGTVDQVFTISNIGSGTLTINSTDFSITGTDANQFNLIGATTLNLTNGQSGTVRVQFAPITPGSKTANLTINDNISDAVNNIPLTGTGILNAPKNLVGGLNTSFKPSLTWQATENEIKIDDGTVEAFFFVKNPTSINHMIYNKMVSPHNGTISQIAIYTKADAPNRFNSVMMCPDDGTGKPHLYAPYATFSNVAVGTSAAWIFLRLSTPQAVTVGQTFYIVAEWPSGSTTGPYVGVDITSSNHKSYWTSNSGSNWNLQSYPFQGNYLMRAYMGTYSDKLVSGVSSPETKLIPVSTVNEVKIKTEGLENKKEEKTISVPAALIYGNNGERVLSSYTVRRGTTSGTYTQDFTGISALTYDDNSVTMGNTYYYVVDAVYTEGTSSHSNEVVVTAQNPNYGSFAIGGGSSYYKFSNSTQYGSPEPNGKPTYEWYPTGSGSGFTEITYWEYSYVKIPFTGNFTGNFKFFGTNYNKVYVCLNGYITFGSGYIANTQYPLPSPLAPPMIAAAFMSLDHTVAGCKILYKDFGDRVVISYENIYAYGTSDFISFQIVLFMEPEPLTNSRFVINYNDDLSSTPLSSNSIVLYASVGVNGPSGVDGYNYRFAGTKGPMFVTGGRGQNQLALSMADINSPLPVKLSSFSSQMKNRDVILNWVTENEINNAGFEIERKAFSANEWTKVAYLEGRGNTNSPTTYKYEDKKLSSGKYNYRLKQIDVNGGFEYHNLANFVEVELPTKYDLSQNYPNPFNPVTKINYDLPKAGQVSLKVYDILGKEVSSVINEFKDAGYYTISFDASNLASGVYFYKLTAGEFSAMKKLVVLK